MRYAHRNPKMTHAISKSQRAVVALILAGTFPAIARAQSSGQKTYPSAEAAGQALADAAAKNDVKAMLEVLGPQGKKIISSGDPAQDQENRSNFANRYKAMHRMVTEPDGTTTLYVGAENWPSPIPLMKKGNIWYFDTVAGKKEILYRRIGKNELSAIRVCQQLVAAQKQYYSQENKEYAQRFVSDEGKQNGLYWPGSDPKSEGLIGPLLANAGSDGVVPGSPTGHEPFRGYYYQILDGQGENAQGGASSYVVDGKMTKGFAFVAYPAIYRDSGVMTFLVGPDGVVYEKDLGKRTAERVKAMKAYDPDSTWQKSENPEQSADNKQKSE
ncbi:MAG: DUF2950 domain-containing protein [Candidatus Acidiferrales bacterium]